MELECPCGSTFRETVFEYIEPPAGETAFDIGDQSYQRRYDKCTVCGHYLSVTDMDLGFLYDGAYVDQTYGDKMRQTFEKIISLPKDKSDNEGRAQYVLAQSAKFFSAGQKITLLDVGAGLSVFPWRMKQAGWDVTALDPDERTATHARDVVGVKAIAADFMGLDSSSVGPFDVISFNKVLEHVEEPVAMLKKALGLLNPNGFIYVELPDVAASVDGKGREEFFIEHHHVFSLPSYAILAERAGFDCKTVERLIEPSGKYTLRGVLTRGKGL